MWATTCVLRAPPPLPRALRTQDKLPRIFAIPHLTPPLAHWQFYEDGISCSGDKSPNCKADATSHRFVDTFENVYTAPSLQVPWWFNAYVLPPSSPRSESAPK